ncbi:site-specific integrase [Paeniglutamicibacter antarcticus]|uniref:Site-specific integrase n=1 Tax=Arthrobacter terrae TaxID=2935737 RepID=A0A931CTK7_9MICC|nr:site-specific integrase [Arthrobacter terrae]MBG0740679.1 site-specific integrase [Arthrobacter terrae]
MASIVVRPSRTGPKAYQVRWRDPEVGSQQSITFVSETEAVTLKKLLDANGQSFKVAQDAILDARRKVPSVTEVVQEHIDLLVRPSVGTVRTYQTMLNLHIVPTLGSIAVDRVDIRHLTAWIKSMQKKGRSAKTIKNVHALLYSAMETAIALKYRSDNPCRRVQLPTGEKPEDEARFLTHREFGLIMDGMKQAYKVFTEFLVMTGTRFGEATAVTVADVDLLAKPATVRINKAWKRGANSEFYLGATKTGAGKRTVALNPQLVERLIPLVATRAGTELLFPAPRGGQLRHRVFWAIYWLPAVKAAQAKGLVKEPRIHDLRHTHASWLIQDGVSLFTISRRLGHASTSTTEQIYGHLMPQALQDAADAVERSSRAWQE